MIESVVLVAIFYWNKLSWIVTVPYCNDISNVEADSWVKS